MPDWRLIENPYAWSSMSEAFRSPLVLRLGMLVFDGYLMSHICLWSGMLVTDGFQIRYVGLQWVSDGSPIGLQFFSDNNNICMNSFIFANFRLQRYRDYHNLLCLVVRAIWSITFAFWIRAGGLGGGVGGCHCQGGQVYYRWNRPESFIDGPDLDILNNLSVDQA